MLTNSQTLFTPQERARMLALAAELKRRGLAPTSLPQTPAAWRGSAPTWADWLRKFFPGFVSAPFSMRHEELWEWAWALEEGARPAPFVAIWPRGGSKSMSAELATVMVGLFGARRYAIYVCETQEQADGHVGTIAGILESVGVERAVNKYGSSRGWRRNRLRARGGFTLDALGLDTAARGIKVDADRPGFMVLDDVDGRHDTPAVTRKKIETLTTTILPAGSDDCAVLAVQNLIHSNSVFSRLADGRADFLQDRVVSGPYRALENFAYELAAGEYAITGGAPTWAGQSVKDCQGFINTWGLKAFERECQQIVSDSEGALWTRDIIDGTRAVQVPGMRRVVVGVDPSGGSGPDSAETGIVVVGVGEDGEGYVLDDMSLRAAPNEWALMAITAYNKHDADAVVGEVNNGGEMVGSTIQTLASDMGIVVPFTAVRASRGKHARAEPVSALYAQGRVHHVGLFSDLEGQMTTWVTGDKSPDRLDALVWAVTELGIIGSAFAPAATMAKAAKSGAAKWHPAYAPPLRGGRWGRAGEDKSYRRR